MFNVYIFVQYFGREPLKHVFRTLINELLSSIHVKATTMMIIKQCIINSVKTKKMYNTIHTIFIMHIIIHTNIHNIQYQ